MLDHQTAEKLSSMRLSSMVKEYRRQIEHPQTQDLTFEERFGMIVDAEWLGRKNNRLHRLLKGSNMRISDACLEDVDYSPERRIDKDMVSRLADCGWIREGRTLLVTGATGTGKTYLACAFGTASCRQDLKTKYYRVNRLFADLMISRGDGSYNKLLRDLKRIDLLILDDFGMAMLEPASSRDLLEVIDDRMDRKGTLIASQLPVAHWHDLFEDSTVADAVLDRVMHSSYRFELHGDTKRKTVDYANRGDDKEQ